MFKKLLVPVDGSEHSDKALQYAAALAKEHKSNLIVLHIYQGVSLGITTIEPDMRKQVASEVKEEEKIILNKALEFLKEKGVKAKAVYGKGNISEEIVKLAMSRKVDLIVMGARGISRLKGCLLGSISQSVVQSAPCPVLVVR